MRYKPGDKVIIFSAEESGMPFYSKILSSLQGCVVTIEKVTIGWPERSYRIKEDEGQFSWHDYMIKGPAGNKYKKLKEIL